MVCQTCTSSHRSFLLCPSCATSCHAGHTLVPAPPGTSFYCDCGPSGSCSTYTGPIHPPSSGPSTYKADGLRSRLLSFSCARSSSALLVRDTHAKLSLASLLLGPGCGAAGAHAPGVAALGAYLLAETVSAAERASRCGASLSIRVHVDHVQFALSGPGGCLDQMLEILADVVAHIPASIPLGLAVAGEAAAASVVRTDAANGPIVDGVLDAMLQPLLQQVCPSLNDVHVGTSVAQLGEEALYSALTAWLARARASPVSLVTLGKNRINTVQGLVWKNFGDVLLARGPQMRAPLPLAPPTLDREAMMARYIRDPVAAPHPEITFAFPLLSPAVEGNAITRSHAMLLHLLSFKGAGSLGAEAFAQGLALDVRAYVSSTPSTHAVGLAFLCVTFEAPCADDPDVVAACGSLLFTYLGLLQAFGPARWLWGELMAADSVRGSMASWKASHNVESDADLVAYAIDQLRTLPPTLLSASLVSGAPHGGSEFDPELYMSLLGACLPSSVLVAVGLSETQIDMDPVLSFPAHVTASRYVEDTVEPHWEVSWELARSRGELVFGASPGKPQTRRARALRSLGMTFPARNIFSVSLDDVDAEVASSMKGGGKTLPEVVPGYPFGSRPYESVVASAPHTRVFSLPRRDSLAEARHVYVALFGLAPGRSRPSPASAVLLRLFAAVAQRVLAQESAYGRASGLMVDLVLAEDLDSIHMHLAGPLDLARNFCVRLVSALVSMEVTDEMLGLALADVEAHILAGTPLAPGSSPESTVAFMMNALLGIAPSPDSGLVDELGVLRASPPSLSMFQSFVNSAVSSLSSVVVFGYGLSHPQACGLGQDLAAVLGVQAGTPVSHNKSDDAVGAVHVGYSVSSARDAIDPDASYVHWSAIHGEDGRGGVGVFWQDEAIADVASEGEYAGIAVLAGCLEADLGAALSHPDLEGLVSSLVVSPKVKRTLRNHKGALGLGVVVGCESTEWAALAHVARVVVTVLAALDLTSLDLVERGKMNALAKIKEMPPHLSTWQGIINPIDSSWVSQLDANACALGGNDLSTLRSRLMDTPPHVSYALAHDSSPGHRAHAFSQVELAHGLRTAPPPVDGKRRAELEEPLSDVHRRGWEVTSVAEYLGAARYPVFDDADELSSVSVCEDTSEGSDEDEGVDSDWDLDVGENPWLERAFYWRDIKEGRSEEMAAHVWENDADVDVRWAVSRPEHAHVHSTRYADRYGDVFVGEDAGEDPVEVGLGLEESEALVCRARRVLRDARP